MEKSELTNGCVESPEKVVTTIDVGEPGQPDGEGLGALLVGVLLLSSSLTINLASLLAQSLLNALKPDAIRIQPFTLDPEDTNGGSRPGATG